MKEDKILNEECLEREPKQKKKKRWLILLLILLLLGAAGAAAYQFYENSRPKSKFEMDQNALAGFLPGKTEEEIQAELSRIIEEGKFNVSMNSQMILKNGKLDIRVENVPANHYNMQVDLYLYPNEGSQEGAELIYQSGVIKPGYNIEEVDVKTKIPAGVYDGQAVFHALQTRSNAADESDMEEIGATALNVVIKVE